MDAVHELIVRSLQGLLTPSERVRLAAWRWAAPQNERYFREVERVWALTGLAYPAAPRPPPGLRGPSASPSPGDE